MEVLQETPCQLALSPWQQSEESTLPPKYTGSRQAVPTSQPPFLVCVCVRVCVCVCVCVCVVN